ncbi:MAG: response regulator [Deltaproteobacteria bacterium]|nr:response regulator [Deltaproteobacteria bacterium]
MPHKKQPVEITCSACNTGFRLWVPAQTIQEWGADGGRISCVRCGAEYLVKKGKKGLEAAPAGQTEPIGAVAGPPTAAREAAGVQTRAEQPGEPAPPAKETVLVIDDDKLAREIVKNALKDIGIRLATAQNSAEALKFIRNESVDLIVTDLYLKSPGDPETLIDGEELLKKISEMGMSIPAIITTGKDIIDDIVLDPKWFDLRVKGFIQKGNPFWAEELKLKLKEVMYKD